ncbi:MAG TPA: DnaA N-terminal domain-containing protein, partial [Candidatus Deferrimicrobiaceae bacterium]
MTSLAWGRILDHLKESVSDQVFETWLRPLRLVTLEGSLLLVAAPHQFFKQWIEDNFLSQIEDAVRKETGGEISVEIVVGGEEDGVGGREVEPELGASPDVPPPRQRSRNGALNPRYTFDRFVVGAGNQFAQAASFAVATDPAKSYNP